MVSVYILFLFYDAVQTSDSLLKNIFCFQKEGFLSKKVHHIILQKSPENQHLLFTGEAKNLKSMFGTLTYRSKIEPKNDF